MAGVVDGRFEADKLASVVEEDLAVAGEVIRFQGGCVEGGFGVEETAELGDEGFSLRGNIVSQVSCGIFCRMGRAMSYVPSPANLGWLLPSAVRRL